MANSFIHWRKLRELSLVYLTRIKRTSYAAIGPPMASVFIGADRKPADSILTP